MFEEREAHRGEGELAASEGGVAAPELGWVVGEFAEGDGGGVGVEDFGWVGRWA